MESRRAEASVFMIRDGGSVAVSDTGNGRDGILLPVLPTTTWCRTNTRSGYRIGACGSPFQATGIADSKEHGMRNRSYPLPRLRCWPLQKNGRRQNVLNRPFTTPYGRSEEKSGHEEG